MTFYMDDIQDDNLVNRNFEFVYNIIRQTSNKTIFYNTMNNQFTATMENVNENSFIYDRTTKALITDKMV